MGRLEVEGATRLNSVPWIAATIFVALVLVGRAFPQLWLHGSSFLVALLLAGYVMAYPVRLFKDKVHLVSLPTEPSEEAIAGFERKFRVATVVFSASGMGTQLAIREDQFISEMNDFIKIHMQNQAQAQHPAK